MFFFGVRELSAHCLQSGAMVGLYLTRHSSYSFRGPGAASISFLCFSYPITSRRSRDDGKVQSSNRLKATYSYAQNTQHLTVIQGNCPHFNMQFPCNIFFLCVKDSPQSNCNKNHRTKCYNQQFFVFCRHRVRVLFRRPAVLTDVVVVFLHTVIYVPG
jgi:hypothetical protein